MFAYLPDLHVGPAYPDITERPLLENNWREWEKNQITQALESAKNEPGDEKQSLKVSLGHNGGMTLHSAQVRTPQPTGHKGQPPFFVFSSLAFAPSPFLSTEVIKKSLIIWA